MNRPLLILDLDETLVYGVSRPLAVDHDFRCGKYFLYKRPGVEDFIGACAEVFELAVWTSSTPAYGRCVVQGLFPPESLAFLWARERCTRRFDVETQMGYWVKDLKKVKKAGYDLDRVLMVDDSPEKLERNYGNLVLVPEFRGDPADRELPVLAGYLTGLASAADFRRIDKRGWRNPG